MSRPHGNLSKPALLTAMEANTEAFWRHFACLPGAELHEDRRAMWLITGISHLPLNGVLRAQLSVKSLEADIGDILGRFQSRNLPMLWWIGPSTRPPDLGEHLQAHGLTHSEELPAMAVDLGALNPDVSEPPGLAVSRVTDNEGLDGYFQAWTLGFEETQPVVDAFRSVYRTLAFGDDAPMRHYVGRVEGAPVATASLYLGVDVVYVYSVTTVPEARRRGIGAAMTVAALRDARARGYRVATLHATELGLSLYRRLGFRECGKVDVYTWGE